MEITFLIGNGFDIRMGLKSGYTDAERNYCNVNSDNSILKKFKNQMLTSVNGDAFYGNYWENFEIGMGKYTAGFSTQEKYDYELCIDDFAEQLVSYLEKEEAKIDYGLCSNTIKADFQIFINEFYYELRSTYQNKINDMIKGTQDTVNFNFISFNYTHILDEILKIAFDNSNQIGKHTTNGLVYNHFVKIQPIHVHGELPGPIIMGVDDATQISNLQFESDAWFADRYIKPATNRRLGADQEQISADLINRSLILCVFGMSLGETDKTWWKQIGSIMKNSNRYLLIFAHNDDIKVRTAMPAKEFNYVDEIKGKFVKLADLSENEDDTAAIKSRIFVVVNSKLIEKNLVKLTDDLRNKKMKDNEIAYRNLEGEYAAHVSTDKKKLNDLVGVK